MRTTTQGWQNSYTDTGRALVGEADPSFEATLQRAASTPGPSDYSISSTLNRSGGRFAYTLNLDDDDDATVET